MSTLSLAGTESSELLKTGRREWLAYGALLMAGAILSIACRFFPADLPFWMPWEFSWPVFLVTGLALGWFALGLARLPQALRPALWRRVSFVLGVLATYAVLQTHVDYYAQHMFFVHRAQHFVLHHVGAFLIALGMPGEAIWAGMPQFLKPVFASKPVRGVVDVIQHPAVAPVLFVGLIYLWLIPAFHTRVMLDANLYNVMNASMAVDGIFFWSLILDSRPHPPARLGFGLRALLVIAVEPFQMVLGALLSLSSTDYYPVYRICGRIWDIPALSDQHYGGLIIWLPSTLTSLAGMICVLVSLRIHEERLELEHA
ncbi:MAG TPA: cytochrome c oxidase assembly protein [Rhizomicrobium sp.]|jgi:putative membrane protein|nr:cytochrome c oxidase assembly protein [Rhizomicrobium sp.]